jgi:hypothetical protein
VLFVEYDQVKEDEMRRACSTHGDKMNVYRVLATKPKGKKPVGILGCEWEDNIKTDL